MGNVDNRPGWNGPWDRLIAGWNKIPLQGAGLEERCLAALRAALPDERIHDRMAPIRHERTLGRCDWITRVVHTCASGRVLLPGGLHQSDHSHRITLCCPG